LVNRQLSRGFILKFEASLIMIQAKIGLHRILGVSYVGI